MFDSASSAARISNTSELIEKVKQNRGTQVAIVLAFFILVIGIVSVTPSNFQSGSSVDRPGFGEPEPSIGIAAPPFAAPAPSSELVRSESSTSAVLTQERMAIFTGRIAIERDDVKAGVDQVIIIAQQANGFVSGTSSSSVGDRERASVTIRVPQETFFATITAIESLGKVRDKVTSSDDVTEQFVDLNIRRDNLQKQETRFLEILEEADEVSDILEIERELGRVRGQIERLTGRINFLQNQVSLSTITTTFTQPTTTPLPGFNLSDVFRNGLQTLFAAFSFIVNLFFALILFVIIGAPIYYANKKRKERRARKQTSSKND
ncbi:MAG: DUF4349 domain-containing protein [Nitrososphaerales archaeon]